MGTQLDEVERVRAYWSQRVADVTRERDELKERVALLEGELACAETEIEELTTELENEASDLMRGVVRK